MRTRQLLTGCSLILALGMSAATLSPDEAMQRAMTQSGGRHIPKAGMTKLAYTASTESGAPAVYVFNNENGGSIFLSASDRAIPMLGYTDGGNFDENNIPAPLQAWLAEYAAQIEYAEVNSLPKVPAQSGIVYPLDWEYIAPLVQTQWDQTNPFNLMTHNQWPTGCVATAMAQIVNYWKYPTVGHGTVSYVNTADNQMISLDFSLQDFQWDLMLDKYSPSSPQASKDAVAYLMKACGVSARMQYQSNTAGAMPEDACRGLIENFGYSEEVRIFPRFEYSGSQWAELVYNQLSTVGPVLYSADATSVGHAFVCDGYDGNGYFHFNWGWSGMSDGFYSLNALNPSSQGTGGSSFGGFNFSQGIIGNIKPAEGTPTFVPEANLTFLGNMSAVSKRNYMTFSFTPAYPANFVNNSCVTITPVFGYKMVNMDTQDVNYYDLDQLYINNAKAEFPTLQPSAFMSRNLSMDVELDLDLPDGEYKAQLVWKDKGTDTWKDLVSSYANYDYVMVTKDGSTFSVENMPFNRFTIESAEVITPLYIYNPCQIRFVVTNPTDFELTQSIIPILYKSTSPQFEGDTQLVTVGPHETITVTLAYTFKLLETGENPTPSTPVNLTLGAYDYNLVRYSSSGQTYSKTGLGVAYYGDFGKVSIAYSKLGGYLELDDFAIADAEIAENYMDAVVYNVSDFSNIVFNADITAVDGNVQSPFTVIVYDENGKVVAEKTSEELISVKSGDSSIASVALNIENYDEEAVYYATAYYVINDARVSLGTVYFKYVESDVETGVKVLGTEDAPARYFNLQGVEISNPAPGSIYIKLSGGKATKNIAR